MQYIKKSNTPPTDWELWFTKATGERTYDYADYQALMNLGDAKKFLLQEQNYLCAYCQKNISAENASIEHVIPKSYNKELSTNYYNLVAVCKEQIKDEHTGKLHCDKEKGDSPITSFIFFSDSDVSETKNNAYFNVGSDGMIMAKGNLPMEKYNQVQSFIDVLNLNHKILKESRAKDTLDGILQAFANLDQKHRTNFWRTQLYSILNDKNGRIDNFC